MEENFIELEEDWLARERALIGDGAVEKLRSACIMIIGCGGVGGYAVEAIVRSGVGRIVIADHDRVSVTNINRQIVADRTTVGLPKAEVARSRCGKINPECEVTAVCEFVTAENIGGLIDLHKPSYIIDAIDSVSSKIDIIVAAKERKVPVISCMGTGNHLDIFAMRIADISKTEMCPLAKAVRQRLGKLKIKGVDVLFSTEAAVKTGNRTPASISFVPAAAGLMIAGHAIKKILENSENAE